MADKLKIYPHHTWDGSNLVKEDDATERIAKLEDAVFEAVKHFGNRYEHGPNRDDVYWRKRADEFITRVTL